MSDNLTGDLSAPAPYRAAAVQMDPLLGNLAHNTATIVSGIAAAASAGATLVVFPECALTGYVVHNLHRAREVSARLNDASLDPFIKAFRNSNLYAIIGTLELDAYTGNVYNSAWIVGPKGFAAAYHKTYLPVLGVDRFVTRGDALPVFEFPFGRVGILICYDLRFPEAARILALAGADLIAVPTNWPEGAESSPDFLTRARAWENRVYLLACNRVGVEEGVRFIGRSQIVSPAGEFLASADSDNPMMLIAEIDPIQARRKRLVIKPGEFGTRPRRRSPPIALHQPYPALAAKRIPPFTGGWPKARQTRRLWPWRMPWLPWRHGLPLFADLDAGALDPAFIAAANGSLNRVY